jgi:hypothetical protein
VEGWCGGGGGGGDDDDDDDDDDDEDDEDDDDGDGEGYDDNAWSRFTVKRLSDGKEKTVSLCLRDSKAADKVCDSMCHTCVCASNVLLLA